MRIGIFVFMIELYFRFQKKRVFEFDSLKQNINCPKLLPRSLPKNLTHCYFTRLNLKKDEIIQFILSDKHLDGAGPSLMRF